VSTITCSVAECPFQVGGKCLEAFDDPADCPNTDDVESASGFEADDVEEREDESHDAEESDLQQLDPFPPSAEEFVNFGTTDSLGTSQANDLRAARRAPVVLLAGEVSAGKSTLIVEIFGKFLKGPYQGWDFAGSETLQAFDRLHAPARGSSGRSAPETLRTPDEGARFLHLALNRDHRLDLLLSDLSGELFAGLVDGAPVAESIPTASVADKCLFLIDGSEASSASTLSRLFTRARRMLGALTEPGGLVAGTPTLIIATKADLWSESMTSIEGKLAELKQFAEGRGMQASVATVAARPTSSGAEVGMPEVFEWLTSSSRPSSNETRVVSERSGRQFWQDRRDE
jgi:hypothetical protein